MALSQLSVDRTTASYKMNCGLAESFGEKLVQNLRQTQFSFNIDESTISNDRKVLAVLVSFYNKQSKFVVCEHWESKELIKVSAESIYGVIPVMKGGGGGGVRGKKPGVETRLREGKAHIFLILTVTLVIKSTMLARNFVLHSRNIFNSCSLI